MNRPRVSVCTANPRKAGRYVSISYGREFLNLPSPIPCACSGCTAFAQRCCGIYDATVTSSSHHVKKKIALLQKNISAWQSVFQGCLQQSINRIRIRVAGERAARGDDEGVAIAGLGNLTAHLAGDFVRVGPRQQTF